MTSLWWNVKYIGSTSGLLRANTYDDDAGNVINYFHEWEWSEKAEIRERRVNGKQSYSKKHEFKTTKAELPHPVYACVFRIALRFGSKVS